MGTAALVHTFCGLYEINEGPEAVLANHGLAKHLTDRLRARGGAGQPVRMGRLDVLPHDPVSLAALADDTVRKTPGLRVWLHAEIIAARGAENLEEVDVMCRGARLAVSARAMVDATGDATLTALAGAAFRQVPAEQLQRPAYICQLRGVESSLLDEAGRLRVAHAIATAVQRGDLNRAALGTGCRPSIHPGEAFLTVDLAGNETGPWDPLSPDSLAVVEQTGRAIAREILKILGQDLAGWAWASVAAWPARAGVRESRRVTGVYELTEQDLLSGTAFADGIARATWPLELRETVGGPRWRFPPPGKAGDIPLRSLRHRDVMNLYTAGRCLSATHEAQASVRVMGTCLATGEAAGLAAAWHVKNEQPAWVDLAARIHTHREQLSAL